ncbi:5-hydroxytryptamine receptor 1B-like [Lingula anatina]|uniref:5-hydroxytryptamine receptor 1B-like n=1 Tax=Lingula anatina TaxID=7574 RepID=A0A2R2MIB8_LINAN|nr:5-hydroxytryptamine receptor 1B-like [Lingula anatina]|eukprot:XP_023929965.1 5-hydroxytryptamine receptor 1B-like [Lingula anatina]
MLNYSAKDFITEDANMTLNKTYTVASACTDLVSCLPFITVEVILLVATIVGNIIFIAAFAKFKELREPTNYILMSLSITDLVTGLVAMPIHIVTVYFVDNLPGLRHLASEKYFCLFKTATGSGLILISLFHQTLIAFDRYFKICRHVQHVKLFNKKRLTSAIVFTWLYGVALSIPPLFGWNDWSPDKECRGNIVHPKHMRFLVTPHLPICLLITFGCYCAIFRRVRQQRQKIGVNSIQMNMPGTSTAKTENQTKQEREEFRGGKALSVKPEESNSKGSLDEMQVKVAKMTAIIVGTFTLLFIPYTLLSAFDGYIVHNRVTFHIIFNISIELLMLSSVTNPLIYGILNKRVGKFMIGACQCKPVE